MNPESTIALLLSTATAAQNIKQSLSIFFFF